MFDFRQITPFCLEKRLSKHKMTIFSKNVGGAMAPLAPPGCAYESQCLYLARVCYPKFFQRQNGLLDCFFKYIFKTC